MNNLFDIAINNDTDDDQDRILTAIAGLTNLDYFLGRAMSYLFSYNNPPKDAVAGETAATDGIIDSVTGGLKPPLVKVPLGFAKRWTRSTRSASSASRISNGFSGRLRRSSP
ncbi:MAG: hypothetical protein ACLQAT_14185 [Candidatus Binataceae bacterium]